MEKLNANVTLGEVVAQYPMTVRILNSYKIDYCCGGDDLLVDAIKALGLDEVKVIRDLEEVIAVVAGPDDDTILWKTKSINEILDYVLDHHHVFMKETLHELNDLVFKILKVHFAQDGEILLKVHHSFGILKTELEAHLVKEEENLFPLIREYARTNNPKLVEAIREFIKNTEDEHDAAGDLFKELEQLTNDFTAPANACYTYKRTYMLLDALEKDTFNHIHLENSIFIQKNLRLKSPP